MMFWIEANGHHFNMREIRLFRFETNYTLIFSDGETQQTQKAEIWLDADYDNRFVFTGKDAVRLSEQFEYCKALIGGEDE